MAGGQPRPTTAWRTGWTSSSSRTAPPGVANDTRPASHCCRTSIRRHHATSCARRSACTSKHHAPRARCAPSTAGSCGRLANDSHLHAGREYCPPGSTCCTSGRSTGSGHGAGARQRPTWHRSSGSWGWCGPGGWRPAHNLHHVSRRCEPPLLSPQIQTSKSAGRDRVGPGHCCTDSLCHPGSVLPLSWQVRVLTEAGKLGSKASAIEYLSIDNVLGHLAPGSPQHSLSDSAASGLPYIAR